MQHLCKNTTCCYCDPYFVLRVTHFWWFDKVWCPYFTGQWAQNGWPSTKSWRTWLSLGHQGEYMLSYAFAERTQRDLCLAWWTLSLTRCYLKTTNRNAKFEIVTPFFFFSCKQTFIKMHSIESRSVIHRTRKYTLCRRVCALFCLDVLQAGAVKGLILNSLGIGRGEGGLLVKWLELLRSVERIV